MNFVVVDVCVFVCQRRNFGLQSSVAKFVSVSFEDGCFSVIADQLLNRSNPWDCLLGVPSAAEGTLQVSCRLQPINRSLPTINGAFPNKVAVTLLSQRTNICAALFVCSLIRLEW